MNKPSLLSIDPGSPFGWAFFSGRVVSPEEIGVVDFEGETKGSKTLQWLTKTDECMGELDLLIRRFKPQTIACEFPTFFGGQKGRTVAESGSLIKLATNFGGIKEQARRNKIRFWPVRVVDWMGTLNERQVWNRVGSRVVDLNALCTAYVPAKSNWTHAVDAIGIGLSHLTGKPI